MKCSVYASSAEALDPVSLPFHGASLEGNLLYFILSTKLMSVSYVHGQCKLH